MLMTQTQRGPMATPYEGSEQGIDIHRYLAIFRRRILFLAIPFLLVAAVGGAVVMLLPPIYLAEAKILVESQQIPTDLVRPTITATAKERIQVIEQRIMTRDNLMTIIDKFRMFPGRRNTLSNTQLLDLMRERAKFSPYELNPANRAADLTIALTIGFEYEDPDIAMRVTNELMTLILAEDARNRAGRAQETTNFLDKEAKKLRVGPGLHRWTDFRVQAKTQYRLHVRQNFRAACSAHVGTGREVLGVLQHPPGCGKAKAPN